MNFVTMFLVTKNVDLIKDVGMIPYTMAKEYGFDAHLVTYKNEEYTYSALLPKLSIDYLKKRIPGRFIDGMLYLLKHGKKIDVLNLYHVSPSSFLWILIYRLVNRNGISYLKLDFNYSIYESIKQNNFEGWYRRKIIRLANLVSVESRYLQMEMQTFFNREIIYIPNGCILTGLHDMSNKENILLTVGRIGTKEKATDVLLEAFAQTIDSHEWKLQIVGSIESDFEEFIESLFQKYPNVKERIEFVGAVLDRNKLQHYYRKAKIFLLPSRWEGCPIVLPEALSNGCYIITSDKVPSACDVTANGKYGSIVESDNVNMLKECIIRECSVNRDWEKLSYEIMSYANNQYDWKNILDILNNKIKDVRENELL